MQPQFKSFAQFASMDGDAGFVFGAWGLSLALIIVLILRAIVTGRRQKARLAALENDLPS